MNKRRIKDIFFLNESKLIVGDVLEVLPSFPSKSIDAIVTSPPYWGVRDYGEKKQIGLENDLEEYLNKLIFVFKELMRILNNDGTLWLNIGDSYTSGNRKYRDADRKYKARSLKCRPSNPKGLKNKNLIGIPWRLAIKLQESGWYLRSDIIWSKPNGMPESVKDRPYRNHEYIFLFSKSQNYFFNQNGLKNGKGKKLRSVWNISHSGNNKKHSATFPQELVRPCILSSTKSNQYVLDPFCGIGTVGKVCFTNKRKFIGIDIKKAFLDIAKKDLAIEYINWNVNP